MRIRFLAIVVISLAVCLPEASAKTSTDLTELGIEELMRIEVASVFGASKRVEKTTEAPSSVSIITAPEIKKYGWRTLGDILRSLKGFFVTYDRNYTYLGMRGFGRPGDYNTRVLLLIDGHRTNDAVYTGAMFGTEGLLDLDLIERVEVIRGPSSSLYGTNAFFGVVNVVTRRGKAVNGTEISGEVGTSGTYKPRLSYGRQFENGLEVLLSGSQYNSDGQEDLYYRELDSPNTSYGISRNADGDRSKSLFSKFGFHGFTLEGAYVSRTKVIPTGSFGTVLNDSRNHTTDEQASVYLNYEQDLSDQTKLMGRIYYDIYNYDGVYVYDRVGLGVPSDYVLNMDFAKGRWWGGEVQLTQKVFENSMFIAGAEYTSNLRQDQKNYDESPFALYLDDQRDSQLWATFLQLDFPILKDLKGNAGIRHDHYSTFGGSTNPRLALIYNPYDKTILKLLYGSAFRAPNVYELHYHDSGNTSKANPYLKSEEIRTFELVLEQYLTKRLRGSVSIYRYEMENLISQGIDPSDNLLVFRNAGEIEANGIELELDGKWASLLEGRISYALQETKERQTGTVLTNSPKHLAKLNLIVPIWEEKLHGSVEEQFTSSRRTLAGREAGSFFITNFTLFGQGLMEDTEISLSIYNVLNKKYGDPGASEHVQDILLQDGRSMRLKVSYRF